MENFYKTLKLEYVLTGFALLFAVTFALINLTVKPALWFDEGQTIEIAHNFFLFGELDVSMSPGVFSGLRFMVGSNGYPLTIPLAGFFSVFGFGLEQARVYMILWLLAALISIYFVAKSIFGGFSAVASVFLISSFASFYDNGLAVMGEGPGFLFLIWGLFFLIKKRNYFLTGLFFGLSASVKPSMCLLLLPSFFLFAVIWERRQFFKKIFYFILGAVPPLSLWIFLIFPNPFLISTWKTMYSLYLNTTDVSISNLLLKNLPLIFTHSTLIYFELLIFVIICAFLIKKDFDENVKRFFRFALIYGAFAFAYFFKSFGYIRYLLAAELLIFIILPGALLAVFKKAQEKFPFLFKISLIRLTAFAVAAFVIFQTFHLFYYSDIQKSDVFKKTAAFINSQKDATVGIFDLPQVAALIPPDRKYHVMKKMIVPQIGENPLSFSREFLPTLIVFGEGSRGEKAFVLPYKNVLEENYILIKKIGAYAVYQRK